jgi:hypothetical protein
LLPWGQFRPSLGVVICPFFAHLGGRPERAASAIVRQRVANGSGGDMLVVSLKSSVDVVDREEIDRTARNVVLGTYRTARAQKSQGQASFDAALQAYQRSFPHVPSALAKHAVACIIDGSGS